MRPKDPTAAETLNGKPAECHAVGPEGTALVVDWNEDERTDLQAAMKLGLAVVHYDCKSLKLLNGCHVKGYYRQPDPADPKKVVSPYSFIGVTKKENVVLLDNADDVQANLPLHGASIGAGMQRGSSIAVGIFVVGKDMTSVESLDKDKLEEGAPGACATATHFVTAATVGAFALKTVTKGKVQAKAAIDVFGISGASSSNKSAENTDGKPNECDKADPDGPSAPKQCEARTRLTLRGFVGAGAPAPEKDAVAREVICPEGTVSVHGVCQAPAPEVPHDCTNKDSLAECSKQCDLGSGESCAQAWSMYRIDKVLIDDDATSAGYLHKACQNKNWESCYLEGLGVKDRAGALAIFTRACDQGAVAKACGEAGSRYEGRYKSDQPHDLKNAHKYYSRACRAGNILSCGDDADILMKGGPDLPPDPVQALRLHALACRQTSGNSNACYQAGLALESGKGVPADPKLAATYYKLACPKPGSYPIACDRLKALSR